MTTNATVARQFTAFAATYGPQVLNALHNQERYMRNSATQAQAGADNPPPPSPPTPGTVDLTPVPP